MVTEYILGVKSPSTFLLALKDSDQDVVEREGAPCVVILSFRGTSAVVYRPPDRHGIILDIRPFEAESLARSHAGAEEPTPEIDIPLIFEVMHEPPCLVRLQDLLAFLLCVPRDLQLRECHGHESGPYAELTEIDQHASDIREGFLCQRVTILLSGLPDQFLIIVQRQIRQTFTAEDREQIDPPDAFGVGVVFRTCQRINLNEVSFPCRPERFD